MFNKKLKNIILLFLIFTFLIFLFIILKDNKKKNLLTVNNNINKIKVEPKIIETIENLGQPIIKELKIIYPNLTDEQINSYNKIATGKTMVPCKGIESENSCILSVAYITKFYSFCGEIEDKKSKIICSNNIINDIFTTENEKCQLLEPYLDKVQCLTLIFQAYNQPDDCINIKNKEAQEMCENIIYYQFAIEQKNKKICENIKDIFLKNYCEKEIFLSKDTDGDGLSDYKELEIYKTNHLDFDTDNDGYSDYAEILSGYNPKGPGLLSL
jgi:hypothetical protein